MEIESTRLRSKDRTVQSGCPLKVYLTTSFYFSDQKSELENESILEYEGITSSDCILRRFRISVQHRHPSENLWLVGAGEVSPPLWIVDISPSVSPPERHSESYDHVHRWSASIYNESEIFVILFVVDGRSIYNEPEHFVFLFVFVVDGRNEDDIDSAFLPTLCPPYHLRR